MRLHAYLAEQGFYESRTRAAEGIRQGEILVDGCTRKPSFEVSGGENIEKTGGSRFVSKGGDKLQTAVDSLGFRPAGLIFADIGASTGGFTDCLLQNGAKRVYAVDVGESLLHPAIRADTRVVPMENVNARYLSAADFPEPLDGAVMDVSFISQTLMLEALAGIVRDGGTVVTLIKPQFECGRGALGKSGIVRNAKARENAAEKVIACAEKFGLAARGIAVAPLRDRKNAEFLLLMQKGGRRALTASDVRSAVNLPEKERR